MTKRPRKKAAATPKDSAVRRASRPAKSTAKPHARPARLSIALEPSLLRQVDRRAKQAGVTRDHFVAACLRLGLQLPPDRLPLRPRDKVRRSSRDGAATSKQVGAGLDQVLTWMADQQAVLSRIRESLAEVTAAVPIDARPPTPEPGDGDDDGGDDKPRRGKLPT